MLFPLYYSKKRVMSFATLASKYKGKRRHVTLFLNCIVFSA